MLSSSRLSSEIHYLLRKTVKDFSRFIRQSFTLENSRRAKGAADMHAAGAIGDNQAAAPPLQSSVDRRWGFHVGDVVQIVQGRSPKQTYALYCGHGHVIHVWTPSRQSYRVRVDSLRELKSAGYLATVTQVLDNFFLQLLNLTPLEPRHSIQRAKSVLHSVAASRVSNLVFILFARFGNRIFSLLQSLKEAYGVALGVWPLATLSELETSEVRESPLDWPSRLQKFGAKAKGSKNNEAIVASMESTIKNFFGTNAEFLMSEWLGRSLVDFVDDPLTTSQWYTIAMPAETNCLTPLCLMYDKKLEIFRVQCHIARGLPERMAADGMQCGVCWMDFATARVIVMKCTHYLCDPCLRLLPRRECPYCRAPIRFAHEVSNLVKREALRIMTSGLEQEEKAEVVPSNVDETIQKPSNNSEPEHDG